VIAKSIVVHFAGETAVVPISQLARDCSVTISEAEDATEVLVRHGFLTLRPDGTYDATVPDEDEEAR
jgi:DNA-binding IclR family transcriptional regulator